MIAVISDCSASASDPQARQLPVHFLLSGGVFCFVIFMVIRATLNKRVMDNRDQRPAGVMDSESVTADPGAIPLTFGRMMDRPAPRQSGHTPERFMSASSMNPQYPHRGHGRLNRGGGFGASAGNRTPITALTGELSLPGSAVFTPLVSRSTIELLTHLEIA